MEKIRALSRRCETITAILLWLIPLMALASTSFGLFVGRYQYGGGQVLDPTGLSIGMRLVMLVLYNLDLIALVALLWTLRALFALYAGGQVFSRKAALHIRQLGWWLILAGLLSLAGSSLLQIFLHLCGIMPELRLTLDIDLMSTAAGAGALLISRIMYLAASLQEEADLTV